MYFIFEFPRCAHIDSRKRLNSNFLYETKKKSFTRHESSVTARRDEFTCSNVYRAINENYQNVNLNKQTNETCVAQAAADTFPL